MCLGSLRAHLTLYYSVPLVIFSSARRKASDIIVCGFYFCLSMKESQLLPPLNLEGNQGHLQER